MIERTFHTPGPLRLDLTVPAGQIDVETVEGDETHVELEADDEAALDDARVELRERGGGHEVVVEIGRRRGLFGGMIQIQIGGLSVGGLRYRLRVRTPRGAELAVQTAAAEVHARGSYRSAEIKSVSGDVTMDEVAGDAAITTTSGDVRLQSAGGSLRLKTVSGDARVEHVGGTATVQTVSGDMNVADIGSSATAKSVSGELELNVREGEISFTSISGDVRVGVRPGSRIDVDASSVSGDLRSELELGDVPTEGDGPVVVLRGKTVSGDLKVVRAS
jgi:hypothetical protein